MTTNAEEGDLLLRVTGMVPAIDFHPFVVRVAHRVGLRGWVQHDAAGALIRAVGTEDQLVQLVRAIRIDAPPSVSIRALDPDLITADTLPIGDHFAALSEDPEWHDPSPEHAEPLACVA